MLGRRTRRRKWCRCFELWREEVRMMAVDGQGKMDRARSRRDGESAARATDI